MEIQKENLDTLKDYKNYIDLIGRKVFDSSKTILQTLHSIKHCKFLLAIILGAELIKLELIGLIVLDDFINQLHKLIDYKGNYFVQKIKEKEYQELPLGKIVEIFYKKYQIKDETFCASLKTLIEKRNVAVHDIVLKYDGDLEKVNAEIKEYIISEQSMDYIIKKLTPLFNLRREAQTELVGVIKLSRAKA